MNRLELEIAWRYLRSRRGSRLLSLISVIAIGGVVVGVSALVLIMGVMNGLQRDLREKILIGSPDVRVLSYGDMRIDGWRPLLETVRGRPDVVAAAPFVLAEGMVRQLGRTYVEGIYISGIPAAEGAEPQVTSVRDWTVSGDFTFVDSDGSRRGIVLGRTLAAKLDVQVGDTIEIGTLGNTSVNAVTGTAIPNFNIVQREVTGTFETGMYEYDNKYAYVALEEAQALAGLGDAVTGLEVRASNRDVATAVATDVAAAVGYPYRAVDWQQQNSNLFQALRLEKLAMSVILGLIIIVAAFNIVSTLTMVVSDKTREIGILKAMGMTAPRIRRIFLAQGMVIGVVGTGLGVILGIIAGYAVGEGGLVRLEPEVYYIDHLPVAMDPLDVIAVLIASIAVATLATLYPSQQASRLSPIDAIRHE